MLSASKIPSDQCRNDGGCGEALRRGGCGASGFGQIVAVCSGDSLDHPDVAQSAQVPRQPVWREHVQVGEKVGPADTGDFDPWILQGMQQRAVPWFEEVDPLDGLVLDLARLGQPVEGADACGEVVERGQMGEIAPVAPEQDLAQVDQAVDGLLARGQFAVGGPSWCSTLRWCLKNET